MIDLNIYLYICLSKNKMEEGGNAQNARQVIVIFTYFLNVI